MVYGIKQPDFYCSVYVLKPHSKVDVSKEGYSSLQASLPSLLRELTCHMGSHSVTWYQTEVTFPPLPHVPKLVLDLATPEGCKTELTYI